MTWGEKTKRKSKTDRKKNQKSDAYVPALQLTVQTPTDGTAAIDVAGLTVVIKDAPVFAGMQLLVAPLANTGGFSLHFRHTVPQAARAEIIGFLQRHFTDVHECSRRQVLLQRGKGRGHERHTQAQSQWLDNHFNTVAEHIKNDHNDTMIASRFIRENRIVAQGEEKRFRLKGAPGESILMTRLYMC